MDNPGRPQRRAQIVAAARHAIATLGRENFRLRRFADHRDQFAELKELYARAGRGQYRKEIDPDGATVLVIGSFESVLTQLDLTRNGPGASPTSSSGQWLPTKRTDERR